MTSTTDEPVQPGKQQQQQQFVCINCERPVPHLYTRFAASGHIRITHCVACQAPADRYIEYDVTLRMLDMLLLERRVWRHVLLNSVQLRGGWLPWKLAVVCMFCDGYRKWIQHYNDVAAASTTAVALHQEDMVFYAAKQIELYVESFVGGVELLLTVSLCLLLLLAAFRLTGAAGGVKIADVTRALLLANSGKLFFIPALVWSQPEGGSCEIYLQMVSFYVVMCGALAVSITLRCSRPLAFAAVAAASVASSAATSSLHRRLQPFFNFG